jgi:hypothetical protein
VHTQPTDRRYRTLSEQIILVSTSVVIPSPLKVITYSHLERYVLVSKLVLNTLIGAECDRGHMKQLLSNVCMLCHSEQSS